MSPDEILIEIDRKENELVLNNDIKADLFYYETIKDDIERDVKKLNELKKNIDRFIEHLCKLETVMAFPDRLDWKIYKRKRDVYVKFRRDDEYIVASVYADVDSYKEYIYMPNDWVWDALQEDKYLEDEYCMHQWCTLIKEYLEKKYKWNIAKFDEQYCIVIPKEEKEEEEKQENKEQYIDKIKLICCIGAIICVILLSLFFSSDNSRWVFLYPIIGYFYLRKVDL